MPRTRFDPANHLSKQGWEGKGTALRNGHATRPLPVVQKKTLSGIGKDRDEAIPFWDHIFASTAASLSLPNSGTSTPTTAASIPAPTQHPRPISSVTNGALHRETLTPSARKGRDVARRGLYSRFYRSAPAFQPAEEDQAVVEIIAGPSTLALSSGEPMATEGMKLTVGLKSVMTARRKRAGDEREDETVEERQVRRAERARRKAQKESTRSSEGIHSEEVGTPTVETTRGPTRGTGKVAVAMGLSSEPDDIREIMRVEVDGGGGGLAVVQGKRKRQRLKEQLVA